LYLAIYIFNWLIGRLVNWSIDLAVITMLNKILSKKIQFHISLRGLFPFCHSRESGNPSSLSLRGDFPHVIARERSDRSNLNHSGFSLIELMIAAVILAIAVLGIFLAFSNAWMGMADARDRTVATNFAREAMEDVKNMDFELVTNENLGTAENVGTKFTRVIIVNTESDNLKKIDTKVFWTNRQGQYVSVEPSMYISRTLI
jgi:prepilin-type N-terminal cleavage/methylation domain-containing protein